MVAYYHHVRVLPHQFYAFLGIWSVTYQVTEANPLFDVSGVYVGEDCGDRLQITVYVGIYCGEQSGYERL